MIPTTPNQKQTYRHYHLQAVSSLSIEQTVRRRLARSAQFHYPVQWAKPRIAELLSVYRVRGLKSRMGRFRVVYPVQWMDLPKELSCTSQQQLLRWELVRVFAWWGTVSQGRFDALNIPCILSLSFSLLLVPAPILSIMDLTVLLKLAPDSAPM